MAKETTPTTGSAENHVKAAQDPTLRAESEGSRAGGDTPSTSSTEALVQTSETGSIELSEQELGLVSGGSRTKSADKAHAAMTDYLHG